MDALARFMRVRRSAVTRVTVSRCGILPGLLLLCLCLSGCARLPPVATATPQPTATTRGPLVTHFPDELLRSSWQLEGVVVDGEMRRPWNEEQCLAVGYRPEEYYFYTGCNHGYCDPRRQTSVPPGETYVICTLTAQGCVTTPDARGGQRPVEWEQPFADAVMERRAVEVRDAQLWLTGEDKGKPVLVFRRVDTCKEEANYLRP